MSYALSDLYTSPNVPEIETLQLPGKPGEKRAFKEKPARAPLTLQADGCSLVKHLCTLKSGVELNIASMVLACRYGFVVYQDPNVTDIACAGLNGMRMGERTLTVRRATEVGPHIVPVDCLTAHPVSGLGAAESLVISRLLGSLAQPATSSAAPAI